MNKSTDFDDEFMKDLDFEGCHLMGLDSILQVNEVYENFQEVAQQHQSMDDDGFNDRMVKSK